MTDYNYAEFKPINEYAGFILKNDNQNKPGTAHVDAISKAQKNQKDFKLSKYSLLKDP